MQTARYKFRLILPVVLLSAWTCLNEFEAAKPLTPKKEYTAKKPGPWAALAKDHLQLVTIQ